MTREQPNARVARVDGRSRCILYDRGGRAVISYQDRVEHRRDLERLQLRACSSVGPGGGCLTTPPLTLCSSFSLDFDTASPHVLADLADVPASLRRAQH